MLETLSIHECQRRDNLMVQSISRKDLTYAWLAGIIEGEGCISALWAKQTNPSNKGDSKITINICIYNSDMRLIKKISEILVADKLKFCYVADKRSSSRYKSVGLALTVFGKASVKKLLQNILPYIHGFKKDQAEKVIELIDYRETVRARNRENGQFKNLFLRSDEKVNRLIKEIGLLKKQIFSPLEFRRVSNTVLSLVKNPQRLYASQEFVSSG